MLGTESLSSLFLFHPVSDFGLPGGPETRTFGKRESTVSRPLQLFRSQSSASLSLSILFREGKHQETNLRPKILRSFKYESKKDTYTV